MTGHATLGGGIACTSKVLCVIFLCSVKESDASNI